MCFRKNRLLLLLIACICFSCSQPSLNFYSGSLDQAFIEAERKDKDLLVVAYMPGCESCNSFIESLATSKEAKSELSDFLIYKCPLNQVGNEYLAQITYNIASPTSYIFRNGRLTKVVIGEKEPTKFLSILSNSSDASTMYQKNKMGLKNSEYVQFVNEIFAWYRLAESNTVNKKQVREGLNALLKSMNLKSYFFNNYLASKLYKKINIPDSAEFYARQSLEYDDDFSIFLYQNLRRDMKFLAKVNYETTKDPYLQFETLSKNLGSQVLKSKPKAIFKFKNSGKSPLIIKNVLANCDCMKIKWPLTPILPNHSSAIEVVYDSNYVGGFSKVLFVTSNAANEQEKLILTGIIN